MFNTVQALKLYEHDIRALQSEGARERFLEEPEERLFIVRESKQNGILRVSLKELLKPGMFEELYRRFS